MPLTDHIELFIRQVEIYKRWLVDCRMIPIVEAEATRAASLDKAQRNLRGARNAVRCTAAELAPAMEAAGYDCSPVLAVVEWVEAGSDSLWKDWPDARTTLQRIVVKAGLQAATSADNGHRVKACVEQARAAAEVAYASLPAGATMQQAWKFIKANPDKFEGYHVPAQATFARYVREANRPQQSTPRATSGRSIVRPEHV